MLFIRVKRSEAIGSQTNVQYNHGTCVRQIGATARSSLRRMCEYTRELSARPTAGANNRKLHAIKQTTHSRCLQRCSDYKASSIPTFARTEPPDTQVSSTRPPPPHQHSGIWCTLGAHDVRNLFIEKCTRPVSRVAQRLNSAQKLDDIPTQLHISVKLFFLRLVNRLGSQEVEHVAAELCA